MSRTSGPSSTISLIDGFRVVTFDGRKLGVVAGISSHSIVIERRRGPFRSWRAIPSRLTIVSEPARKVTVFASPDAIERSPRLTRNEPVDDVGISRYYQRLDPV